MSLSTSVRSRTAQAIAGATAVAVLAALAALLLHMPFLWCVSVVALAVALMGLVHMLDRVGRQQARVVKQNVDVLAATQSSNQKINDIAGTVGRSAPVIRGIAEGVSGLKGDVAGVRDDVKQAQGVLRPVRQTVPTAWRPAEAPAGLAPAVVEAAAMTTTTKASQREVIVESTVRLVAAAPHDDVVALPKAGASMDVEVVGAREVRVEFAFAASSPQHPKAVVLWCRAHDRDGVEIDHPVLKARSERFGSFMYVARTPNDSVSLLLDVPSAATQITVGLVPWEADVQLVNHLTVLQRQEAASWASQRTMRDVRVAMILDEFSYNSFRPECTAVVLTPDKWREQMDATHPDIFFCESAWSGADSQARPWKGQIYTSTNFAKDPRGILFDILGYCKDKGIPTVFWNKEDPSHFDDKVHDFVDTAVRFDHVFTTDVRCVDRYRLEHGHRSVHALPFAVQPRLFNPIETTPRTQDVVFAGAWYENHRERSVAMRTMFDAITASGRGLKIYDRFFGGSDVLHQFPEEYRSLLNPPVDHAHMARVYKESVIGMTINTETASPTMFARRIFELMACNTFVVSNRSTGIEAFFGDDVPFLDTDPTALQRLDDDEIDAIRERNLCKVLAEHTYRNRLEFVLEVAGVGYRREDRDPAVVLRTSDPGEIARAVEVLDRCPLPGRKVLMLGSSIAPIESARAFARHNGRGLVVVDERLLQEGRVGLSEVLGSATHALFIGAGDVVSAEDVQRMMLHASYVDLPVVLAAAADRYRVERIHLPSTVLVPAGRLVQSLSEAANSSLSLAYAV